MYYSYKGVQISGEICSPPLTPKDGLPTDTGTLREKTMKNGKTKRKKKEYGKKKEDD
jgi:hypothetical protein